MSSIRLCKASVKVARKRDNNLRLLHVWPGIKSGLNEMVDMLFS